MDQVRYLGDVLMDGRDLLQSTFNHLSNIDVKASGSL